MGEETARGAVFFHCNYGAVRVHTFLPSAFLSVPTGPEGASTTTISCFLSISKMSGTWRGFRSKPKNGKRAEEATDSVGVSLLHQEHAE